MKTLGMWMLSSVTRCPSLPRYEELPGHLECQPGELWGKLRWVVALALKCGLYLRVLGVRSCV